MNVQVINIELEQLADIWAKTPQMVMQELTKTLLGTSAMVQSNIMNKLPRGATSHLAQSVATVGPMVSNNSAQTLIGSSLIYAAPVELGTKPHMPPIAPLVDWVTAVLGIEEPQAKTVAFKIARKISKKGTKGNFAYRDAFEQSQTLVRSQFKQLILTIRKKLGKG
ncbi:MAG: hypothetical protein COB35_05005 [Gammaproteobacteria bacterium]|nr:MAG: hypothetical protein COB35_05005 [Gammaproteobacteria bacterium]